ncbi:MAG TPA: tannase/feruloyl esterase family alpha/beta hydrolase [Woeseiaceae bacterium]|nr:tannase/feruloyl esterase family alpha/beta hydrolase [Woeseiaceae bacterium]
MNRGFLLLVFVALGGCAGAPDRATDCTALAGRHVPGGTVTATAVVDEDDGLPAYCRVRGVIDPRIGFEARLPLAGWNGKYYQAGCGGFCGSVLPDKPGFSNTINEALKLGYAAITTDAGHSGGLGDASWAADDPEAVEAYAHRAIPLTHRFGTALVARYYGGPPRYDYFGGCSNGGRMGAMAAQRYPALFDGILAGGSVLDLSGNGGIYGPWVVQSNTDDDGERILTRENFAHKLPVLSAEVLAQCDGADGRDDGLISAPRACTPKLDALPACGDAAAADAGVCFTAAERRVLQRWYAGPRDSGGRQLYPGMPPGSERYWAVWFLDAGGRTAPGNALGSDYPKYLGLAGRVGEDWSARDFDFDADPARLAHSAPLLNATDPDLEAFRAAGGKLLMWHGWADPLVLPDQSVAYHRRVAEAAGGEPGDFLRLFMIPGHGHCWELPAETPDRFNPIRVLERWVEQGHAPERIAAAAANPQAARVPEALLCPWPASAVAVARNDGETQPACPSRE